ncbi:P-loop containing nucleoside triphosphate hydrolase protein [Russula earlei]|uniref:P-loop containing nucleoside triphosphate hydrolase protein n=1 Tax=Russula earlei TaxID=71964 RepID=A0ACC0UN40_9AGAM|nr:P-loop containing nucleoside triphosphate hydrolase protein [Russula earlei]
MSDSFNDPLHLLLCGSLWPKSSSPDCLAQFDFDSGPLATPEPEIKTEPEPDFKRGLGSRHLDDHPSQASTLPEPRPRSVYHAWLASRVPSCQNGGYITAGAQRPLTRANLRLAHHIAELCVPQMIRIFWRRHPFRAFVMVAFSFVRGTFPVFKGFTHALIINEVQSLLSSGHYTWSYLIRLIGAELLAPGCRKIVRFVRVSPFFTNNEHFVQNSARFLVEYQQMEQRVRLDIPTLSDPTVRDLLAESDLFVSSFQGAGGFGLLSPFDLIRVFSLISELASHIFVLSTISYGPLSILALFISFLSAAYPFVQSSLLPRTYGFDAPVYSEVEISLTEKQEQMRQLSLSDTHRPEVMLFGLGPWILQTWAAARQAVLGLNSSQQSLRSPSSIFSHLNVAEIIAALQNLPFVLMLQTSTSLGSLALYRSSVQSIVYTVSTLFITLQMAVQGVFLMGAFCASMEIEPFLKPKNDTRVTYKSWSGGMKIEARNLSYTYPGCTEPALRNVSFTLEAGETLAVVGYNGSGKSTLGKVLSRIVDFNSGELLINDVDVRRYEPAELHRATTAVFQNFCKYNGTVAENVGVGYIPDLDRPAALRRAVRLAEGDHIVRSLPHGINTRLDTLGLDSMSYSPAGMGACGARAPWASHGLSGGEWQRIALARAFMRAHKPEVHFLLFDEPTSALDAHAQNKIFQTIDSIARGPGADGEAPRVKTVLFITHRLSVARRADKIAMMEHGSITEFGTHDELLKRGGSYAALYHASV